MQTLIRNMTHTTSKDISARKKALIFVQVRCHLMSNSYEAIIYCFYSLKLTFEFKDASRDLQRYFVSYYGLDLINTFCVDDELEGNLLKPDVLE